MGSIKSVVENRANEHRIVTLLVRPSMFPPSESPIIDIAIDIESFEMGQLCVPGLKSIGYRYRDAMPLLRYENALPTESIILRKQAVGRHKTLLPMGFKCGVRGRDFVCLAFAF